MGYTSGEFQDSEALLVKPAQKPATLPSRSLHNALDHFEPVHIPLQLSVIGKTANSVRVAIK
jgi:hypothetical protein